MNNARAFNELPRRRMFSAGRTGTTTLFVWAMAFCSLTHSRSSRVAWGNRCLGAGNVSRFHHVSSQVVCSKTVEMRKNWLLD